MQKILPFFHRHSLHLILDIEYFYLKLFHQNSCFFNTLIETISDNNDRISIEVTSQ